MFVFCGVGGLIAIVNPYSVRPIDFLRDCAFYACSILFTACILLDGMIVVWEGVLMCMLYVVYVVVVIYNDELLQMLGEEEALSLSRGPQPQAVEQAAPAAAEERAHTEEEQAARRQVISREKLVWKSTQNGW